MISAPELLFFKLLNLLAAHCKTELTKEQVALYDAKLSLYSYEALCETLDALLEEARPGGAQMPSISEIERRLCNPEQVSDKASANACVQNLIRCVSKFGYTWDRHTTYGRYASFEEALKAECGSLGVEVVRLHSGWSNFVQACNEAQENLTVFRAQLRDLALSLLERTSRGVKAYEMPSLDLPAANPKVKALVGDLVKALPTLRSKDGQLKEKGGPG